MTHLRKQVVQPQDQSIRYIALTQDQIAIIDAKNYERFKIFNWQAAWSPRTLSFYAVRDGGIYMHREVLGITDKRRVDHKDGNTLRNVEDNLREATALQNNMNRRMNSNNKCGFKGVCWHKKDLKFQATLQVNRRTIYLGQYKTPQEAARAYDRRAIIEFGEFARLNFPDEYKTGS